jgi:cytochrome c5
VKHETNDAMAMPAMIFGVLILLAAVIFLASRLVSVIGQNSTVGEIDNADEVIANIAPIGEVNTGAVAAGPVVRGGKEIYEAVCAACHGAGVLGAPKFGDNGQWASRHGNGWETLMANATNGINAMPAKGGDPTLTDDELANAVIYILENSGITVKKN